MGTFTNYLSVPYLVNTYLAHYASAHFFKRNITHKFIFIY
ncbi:MAG: hypothetical protein JWO06_2055 [Bacteroidota bacterium]|nr:hypothetical protein [Bacteroidota bacterium]